MLDAGAWRRAGREGVAFDYDGELGPDRLNVQCLKSAAIQYAEVGETAVGVAVEPVAKIVLAAGVEAQILAHSRALRLQKADQAAEMAKCP